MHIIIIIINNHTLAQSQTFQLHPKSAKAPKMAEKLEVGTESAPAPIETPPPTSSDAHYVEEPTGHVDFPEGWKYRGRRIAGINIPWYASPKIQLGMVAFVCFLCPGMFNALGGMGGGGQTTNTTADNMVSQPHSYSSSLQISNR